MQTVQCAVTALVGILYPSQGSQKYLLVEEALLGAGVLHPQVEAEPTKPGFCPFCR